MANTHEEEINAGGGGGGDQVEESSPVHVGDSGEEKGSYANENSNVEENADERNFVDADGGKGEDEETRGEEKKTEEEKTNEHENKTNEQEDDDKKKEKNANSPDKKDSGLKFFVGGISPDCWENDVLKYFSRYGKVKEVQVMKDASNGRNRGFCFVTMHDIHTYDAIFNDEHKIKNKKVDVREMQPQNLSRKIFVGGINATFNEDNMKDYFSKFGPVEKVTIMRDPEDKRSRGFGFVVFCTEEGVKEALKTKLHQISDEYKVEVRAAEARRKLSSFKSPAPAAPFPSPVACYPPMYNQWGRSPYMGVSPGGMYGYGGGYCVPPYGGTAAVPPGRMPGGGGGGGGPIMPPYTATSPNPHMYAYAAPPYGPQRNSPTAPRGGRGGYRMGPY